MFAFLYERVMRWSQHPHAVSYLAGLSFIEASVFPIPPDVMLAPMSLARPQRAWYFAVMTTLFSVLGALFGYILGLCFITLLMPWIIKIGYAQTFATAQLWFDQWGFWALIVAGFTPIPFKLFTLAAGAMRMNLFIFLIGAIIGRSMRFFLVAALMRWGGARMDGLLRRYVDYLGWGFVVLAVILYITLR
jgi:membrane protein YqaA with SNARE-associated domain